jgi:hypothetical protein
MSRIIPQDRAGTPLCRASALGAEGDIATGDCPFDRSVIVGGLPAPWRLSNDPSQSPEGEEVDHPKTLLAKTLGKPDARPNCGVVNIGVGGGRVEHHIAGAGFTASRSSTSKSREFFLSVC